MPRDEQHAAHWFYRLEVSGGHTGSSEFFHGLVTTDLRAVSAFIRQQGANEQSAMMTVMEGFASVIELYQGDTQVWQQSLWPALTIRADGRAFTFVDGIWRVDGSDITEDMQDDGTLEELLCSPPEASVDLSSLGLPAPSGNHAETGATVDVTSLAGRRYAHKVGHEVGPCFDFMDPKVTRTFAG